LPWWRFRAIAVRYVFVRPEFRGPCGARTGTDGESESGHADRVGIADPALTHTLAVQVRLMSNFDDA
jgi:hypothetical protein